MREPEGRAYLAAGDGSSLLRTRAKKRPRRIRWQSAMDAAAGLGFHAWFAFVWPQPNLHRPQNNQPREETTTKAQQGISQVDSVERAQTLRKASGRVAKPSILHRLSSRITRASEFSNLFAVSFLTKEFRRGGWATGNQRRVVDAAFIKAFGDSASRFSLHFLDCFMQALQVTPSTKE